MVWEEKKYTKRKKISMKPINDGNGSGIIETQKMSNEIECRVIGNQKIWIRKCPECNLDVASKDKWYCKDAHEKGRLCRHCRIKGERHHLRKRGGMSEKQKEKIRNTWNTKSKDPSVFYWYKRQFSDKHKENISKSKIGNKLSKIHVEKIIKANIGNSYRKGMKSSDETKRKLRIARAFYAKRNAGSKICPAFNEKSCLYFEWLNKWNGWNGQYATNKGEYFVKNLGYWVDYYEPNENVVIEWDEPKLHYRNGVLKEKDVKRMWEIKNVLECRFFRYNERTNELKEYK